jgi:uncharacterized protein YabN with tetrapyrrole methylase and pyrophosphatase domain
VVIGTGIRIAGQLAGDAIAWIKVSDKLFHVVADLVAERILHGLNPAAESLVGLYEEGKPRIRTYHAMVDRILGAVRAGHKTCLVAYGHPGVFAYPAHESIRRAREEGYTAMMYPAVSAEDCLFADLGVDPATSGCQSHEATHFMIYGRKVDPSAALILWQVGSFGDTTYRREGAGNKALPVLVERLLRDYPPDHEVVIYEAAIYPGCPPRVDRLPLEKLAEARVTLASTLYVPPAEPKKIDLEMCRRLGISIPSYNN